MRLTKEKLAWYRENLHGVADHEVLAELDEVTRERDLARAELEAARRDRWVLQDAAKKAYPIVQQLCSKPSMLRPDHPLWEAAGALGNAIAEKPAGGTPEPEKR